MPGAEVTQLYIGFKNSKIDRPIKLLRGFDKNMLAPNESKTIDFNLPINELAFYNEQNSQWEVEKMTYEIYVGGSSRAQDLLINTFAVL